MAGYAENYNKTKNSANYIWIRETSAKIRQDHYHRSHCDVYKLK